MKLKFLLLILPLFLTISGCSTVGPEPLKQPAKPVAKKPAGQKPQAGQANAPKPVAPGPKTFALDNSPGNFNDQATVQAVPTFRDQPQPIGGAANAAAPVPPPVPGAAASAPPADTETAMLTPSPALQPPVPAAAQPPAPDTMPVAITLEDAAIPAGTSPAIVALLSESDRSRSKGDLDSAVVVMERALRIDSRNPTITYKLAQLRLKQAKAQQAEELAGKAALLAGSNLELKRKSWLLIAEARKLQNNLQGAREAKAKAESFFGR